MPVPPPPSRRRRRRRSACAAAAAVCAAALYGNVRIAPNAQPSMDGSSVASRSDATAAAATPAGAGGGGGPVPVAVRPRGGGAAAAGRASAVERLSRGDRAWLMPPAPPWLEDYVAFHSNCSAADPATGRAAVDSDPSCPFLVYRCGANGCPGLGGRIKSVIRCFYLAVMTRRVMLIDNPAPVPLRNFLEPNRVRWDAPYVDPNVTWDVFNVEALAERRRRRRYEREAAGGATSGEEGERGGDRGLSVGTGRDGTTSRGAPPSVRRRRLRRNKVWPPQSGLRLPGPDVHGYVVGLSAGVGVPEVNNLLRGFPPARIMMAGNLTGGGDGGGDLEEESKRWQEALHRWGFWTLFKFSDAVLSRARELKSGAGLGAGASSTLPADGLASEFVPYVGVHLRTGGSDLRGWDDAERHSDAEEWGQFLNCSLRFQRRMAEVSETEADSEAGGGKGRRDVPSRLPPIYVASDNADAKRYLRDLARGEGESGGGVVYPPGVDIFHVARSASALVEGGNRTDAGGEGGQTDTDGEEPEWLRRALFRGTLDAYSEIAVLADATCLVMSRSAMSFAAHFLGPERRCGAYVKDCANKSVVEGMYHLYLSRGSKMHLVERV